MACEDLRKRSSAVALFVVAALLVSYALAMSLYGSQGAWVGESADGIPYLETARGFVSGDFSFMGQYRPGYVFSLAIPCSTSLNPVLAGRIHTAVSAAVLLLAFFLLLRGLYGLVAGALFAFLLASTPLFIAYSRSVSPPVHTTALFALSLLFVARIDFHRLADRGWASVGGAFFLALAFTSHPAFLLYAVPLTCCIVASFFYFPKRGPWSARARRSFTFLATMGLPLLFFEVFVVLLICSERYKIPLNDNYLYSLCEKLLRVGPQAAVFAPPADLPPALAGPSGAPADVSLKLAAGGFGKPMESGEWTSGGLANLLLGDSPALWALLALGCLCLLGQMTEKRSALFIFPLCALIPIVYWGVVPQASRSRDVFYSFPGLYLAAAAGFAWLSRGLCSHSGERLGWARRGAAVALYLLVGLVLTSRLARVPNTVASPHVLTRLARTLAEERAATITFSGYNERAYATFMKWTLPSNVAVLQTTPGSRNEDFAVVVIDGPGRAAQARDLVCEGRYRIIFHERDDSTYPTVLKKLSLPALPAPKPPNVEFSEKGNLIENSGFERGVAPWEIAGQEDGSVFADTETALTGKASLALRFPKGFDQKYHDLRLQVDVKPNTAYALEGYVMTDDSMRIFAQNVVYLTARVDAREHRAEVLEHFSFTGWNRFRAFFTTGPDPGKCELTVRRDLNQPNNCPGFTVHFDNLSLREIPWPKRFIASANWTALWSLSQCVVMAFVLTVAATAAGSERRRFRGARRGLGGRSPTSQPPP